MSRPERSPEPPGRRLLELLRGFVSPATWESVFVQLYLDLAEEWREAAESEGRWMALGVRLRGYASFVTAAGAQVLVTVRRALIPARRRRRAPVHTPQLDGSRAMSVHPTGTSEPLLPATTANDRFKRSFPARLWGSIIVATVLHLLAFSFFPKMTAAEMEDEAGILETLELPPDVDIPEAPEPLTKPAIPVATVDVPPDVTIDPTVPGDGGFAEFPAPPERQRARPSDAPRFTPFTVRPEVRNPEAVVRALQREYPPLLRDAGIGGRVIVWFSIDEAGRVQDIRVHESSGQASLDSAALEVGDVFRFTPALNRDETVAVWIQIPIVFDTR